MCWRDSKRWWWTALFLEGVGRGEFLAEAVAANQGGVAVRGEHKAVIRAKWKRFGHVAQGTVAGDTGLLQGGLGGLGLAGPGEVAAKQFAGAAVNDEGRDGPAILANPHPAEVRDPALVRCCGDGGSSTRGRKPVGRLQTC